MPGRLLHFATDPEGITFSDCIPSMRNVNWARLTNYMISSWKSFLSLAIVSLAIGGNPLRCFADELTGTWKLRYVEANGAKFPASAQTIPTLPVAGNT